MIDNLKVPLLAVLISLIGFGAAHNAKWVREGSSPWWTSYIVSFFTASIYAYLARRPIMPLVYTSVFQTFFFHGAWYATAILVLGEHLKSHQLVGLGLVFLGMITMSIK